MTQSRSIACSASGEWYGTGMSDASSLLADRDKLAEARRKPSRFTQLAVMSMFIGHALTAGLAADSRTIQQLIDEPAELGKVIFFGAGGVALICFLTVALDFMIFAGRDWTVRRGWEAAFLANTLLVCACTYNVMRVPVGGTLSIPQDVQQTAPAPSDPTADTGPAPSPAPTPPPPKPGTVVPGLDE